MRESAAYDMFLEEGQLKNMRQVILRPGHWKLGEPDEAVRQSVLAIKDIDRLWRMYDRLPTVSTWDELLLTP